jgi:hypothetical protein
MLKSNIFLQAKIQNFSNDEIIGYIKPDILEKILSKDKHPFFQAYSIAHEGYSHSKVLGIGNKVIRWGKDAIKKAAETIKMGIECFIGHGKDNSKAGREKIGEVVGSIEKEIEGKLNNIVITYHSAEEKEKAKKCDIVSNESEWYFDEKDGIFEAIEPVEITALAFDNSQSNTPAFADAKRLAMVQCFDENAGEANLEESMTLKDVINYIVENKVHISQLPFTLDDVKADRNLGKVFDEAESFKKKFEEAEKLNKDNLDKIKKIEGDNLKITQKNRLESILKNSEIKLTDEERKFILSDERLNRNSDPSDEGLKKFIEFGKEDYKILKKLIPSETNIDLGNIEQSNKDLSDPKNNPLI